MLRLHIGCGDVYLNGWVNIDSESDKADLRHDLRKPLPYDNETVEFIYSEHFIEHLLPEDGELLLRDARRVLRKNGVIRIATPDLDYIVFRYVFGWRKQAWIEKYGYSFMKTKAEMMNVAFHHWGHQWLYNFSELKRRLESSGFTGITRKKYRRSDFSELRDLETREDSKLIVEVVK
jgi:predicted SAM-dependent methyltransferase